MTWYYEQAGEQKGPITDSDLDNLYKSGVVRAETLVWKEGMPSWTSYSQAKGGPSVARAATATLDHGSVVCAECGGTFPPDEVIRYGDKSVCAACKPIFVQKLKEGAVVGGAMEYAGFWIRFGAKVVDGIILNLMGFMVNLLGGLVLKGFSPDIVPLLLLPVTLGLNVAYNTYFIGKFGATPGKMAAKIRVVNADGSKFGYAKALGRYFAEMLSALILMIGYIMAAFDVEKRALHDRICGTRVIKVAAR